MSKWQPIETAPLETSVDVWAKQWSYSDDKFSYRRFTSVRRRREKRFLEDHPEWIGVNTGWCPTHWMPLPEPPEDT